MSSHVSERDDVVPAAERRRYYHYSVYGQKLCSSVPLPALTPGWAGTRDIAFGPVCDYQQPHWFLDNAEVVARLGTNLGCELHVYRDSHRFLLRWVGNCDFWLSADGRNIRFQSGPDTSNGWITASLCGMVLSFALHLMGVGNLHASAVTTPKGAVAFLDEPGGGKSTMAASLAAKGFPFITDDVLAVMEENGEFMAQPGLPYLSLSEQSVAGIFKDRSNLTTGGSNQEKRRIAVDGSWASFQTSPVAMAGMFILYRRQDISEVSLGKLGPSESIRWLLENTNCLPLLPIKNKGEQLAFVARLVERVPVWRLAYPSGFEHVSETIECLTRAIEG